MMLVRRWLKRGSVPPPVVNASHLPSIRAVITTKWGRGYTKRVIPHVESFYVDTSLDNDADSWQITLGDPTGDYLAMMNRDSEVRIELLSADPGGAGHIMTGIADDLSYDQDGAYTISGRDYASLALDSMVEPQKWKKVKPMYVIGNQAKQLGYPQVSLNNVSKWKKVIKTDGSETYWEFWFRLVRNDKAYLWVGPNGALILNRLNYSERPTYYFGTPKKDDPELIQTAHIPVEGLEIRKSTQGRAYKIWTYVNSGKLRTTIPVTDMTIDDWVKRPVKVMQDTQSGKVTGAKKRAWNEIYEGKVGAVEIRLVISDPTYVISPNRMARVRIPEIDFIGTYFIVGTKVQAGPDGFVQEIRLREKEMALSRRVPQEPKIPGRTQKAPAEGGEADVGEQIGAFIPRPDWGNYFENAAREHQGFWDFDIFTAFLLAIAKQESGFRNIRQIGMNIGEDRIEWYPVLPGDPDPADKDTHGRQKPGHTNSRPDWELNFANQVGTHGLSQEAGVGPMQLTWRKWKTNADDWYADHHPKANHGRDQYLGGRWDPESNIMEGARYFKSCLDQTHMEPGGDDSNQFAAMEKAYALYNGGSSESYIRAKAVRKVATRFLDPVRAAVETAQADSADDSTDGGTLTSDIFPLGWPNNEQIIAAFQRSMWWGQVPSAPAAGPISPGLPHIEFIKSPVYTARLADILWIVIHTMENNSKTPDIEENNVAYSVAQDFATGKRGVSSHYCIDNLKVYQCVYDKFAANATAGYAVGVAGGLSTDQYSLQFEHAGTAEQTAAQWGDNYSQNMLRLSARVVADKCKKYGIQVRHLTVPEIQGGLISGICGHNDINDAFRASNPGSDMSHWDPGPNFPWADYIQMVQDAKDAM